MSRIPQESQSEEKFRLQEQQEQELVCLQRQYAILEKDRQVFGLKLGQLNRILSIYKKEHENIKTDLRVAGDEYKKQIDSKDSRYLSKLLVDYDNYDERINKEKQYIKEISDQIPKVEKEVCDLRGMQITDRHVENRIKSATKMVEQLTNKLEVQNHKFGNTCAKIRAVKTQIKRKLWERDVFMKIWKKLISRLVMGKKFMTDLTEQATLAYDQREEWCNKLQALRIKAHMDLICHVEEMRELKRKQNYNQQLEEFLSTKTKKRIMKDLMDKEKIKRVENKIKMEEKFHEYKQHMDDILNFTKETRLEVIAKKFHHIEQENFSLYNRVNFFIQELERMNDELFELQQSITEERELADLRKQQRQTNLETLNKECDEASEDLNHAESELEGVEHYIEEMLSGIETLFKICRCNSDPILQLLANTTKITIYNVSFFLQMAEGAILKALAVVYSNEKNAFERKKITQYEKLIWDDNNEGELLPLNKIVPTSPCPLCIEHEMVTDVVDSAQKILNREEINRLIVQRSNSGKQDSLHSVSGCFLPQSREVLQRRYV